MASSNREVDEWFETYDNPQKELVLQVRQAMLDADERVQETIKWKAPTFMFEGNIASFFPKAKKHVTLMFHQGASLPDPDGILDGDGDTARSLKVIDADDLATKHDAIQALVRAWIAARTD